MARTRHRRRLSGSALLDFGPCLAIALLMLFAFIKLSMVGFAYCACSVLNDLQTQRAAEVTPESAQAKNGIVKSVIVDGWRKTGLGQFVDLTDAPITNVSFQNRRSEKEEGLVTVSTKFTISGNPLPGDIEYTITSRRVIEDNLQGQPKVK